MYVIAYSPVSLLYVGIPTLENSVFGVSRSISPGQLIQLPRKGGSSIESSCTLSMYPEQQLVMAGGVFVRISIKRYVATLPEPFRYTCLQEAALSSRMVWFRVERVIRCEPLSGRPFIIENHPVLCNVSPPSASPTSDVPWSSICDSYLKQKTNVSEQAPPPPSMQQQQQQEHPADCLNPSYPISSSRTAKGSPWRFQPAHGGEWPTLSASRCFCA